MANSDEERAARDARDAQARFRAAMDADGERARALGAYFGLFYKGQRSVGVPRELAAQITGSYVSAFMFNVAQQNKQGDV